MTWLLGGLFALTALLYAAVGFGGGSTYNALLVLSDVDYRLIPIIALTCNIIVVSGGTWRFWRENALPFRQIAPFLVTSVPAAWIGGRIPIPEMVFIGLLGTALMVSGLRLLLDGRPAATPTRHHGLPLPASLALGGAIGGLAGLVGVGGGIFLAPVLYLTGWGTPRQIAGGCSLFIFCNSLSGLSGQAAKLSETSLIWQAAEFWPLALAVLVGGQVGSWLGSSRLQPEWIKRLTAILVLYVAIRLLVRLAAMV